MWKGSQAKLVQVETAPATTEQEVLLPKKKTLRKGHGILTDGRMSLQGSVVRLHSHLKHGSVAMLLRRSRKWLHKESMSSATWNLAKSNSPPKGGVLRFTHLHVPSNESLFQSWAGPHFPSSSLSPPKTPADWNAHISHLVAHVELTAAIMELSETTLRDLPLAVPTRTPSS